MRQWLLKMQINREQLLLQNHLFFQDGVLFAVHLLLSKSFVTLLNSLSSLVSKRSSES